ncbi:hypothetical protein CR513_45722, partial [Mucuna pruriens]
METILEIKQILEASLNIIKINILHVTSTRRQVTCKRVIGIVKNYSASISTTRNLDMLKRTITTKIRIKQISLKGMIVNNNFSTLPKILVMEQEETEKLEVFGIFKKFKVLVKKQSRKIKVLRSNLEKSTTLTNLTSFVRMNGLSNNLSLHILHNKMESLRGRITQPWRWPINDKRGRITQPWRFPTKAVQDKTSIEAWREQKSSSKNLRAFRSIYYIHVPDQKRHKLEDKIVHGIFLKV